MSIKKTYSGICAIITTLLLGMIFTPLSFAFEPMAKSYNSQKGDVVYIKAGAKAKANTSQSIGTKTNNVADSVSATLSEDFTYNGKVIAKQGSVLDGTIIKCQKGSHNYNNGFMQIKFTSIKTTDGFIIPISAIVETIDKQGNIEIDDAFVTYLSNSLISSTFGADFTIPANTNITIIFNQAVTLGAPSGYQ